MQSAEMNANNDSISEIRNIKKTRKASEFV